MGLLLNCSNRRRVQVGVVLALFAVTLLLANVVPKASCRMPASHDGELASYSNGELHYGWPKTFRIETISQETNYETFLEPRYSIGHLLRQQPFKLATSRFSGWVFASNMAIAISALMLLTIAVECLTARRFSIRLVLVTITLVGILISSILCESLF